MNKNKDKEILNTLKKATSNNKTKNQIIDLVKDSIELIKSKEAETFNPKEVEEKKKKEEFIVKTEKLVSPESKEMDFVKLFEDINIKLEEGREKYEIICEAISAVELMNIAGIMASKDALLEKNKIETQKKIQEYEYKLDEAKKKYEEFVAEHNKQSEDYMKEREEL